MSEEWITVKEAARKLSVSERNIRFKISSGKLKAKREGRRWLVHNSLSPTARIPEEGTIGYRSDTEVVDILKSELEKRDKQLEEKDKQIALLQEEMSQSREQSNQLLAAITRQNQLMLEDKTTPWYQRMFKRSRSDEDSSSI